MSKKLTFIAEIDQAELAVRLMEIGIGLKRAGDKRSPLEILAQAEATWPTGMVTPFPFVRMARIAIEYVLECIEKEQRPS